MSAIRLSMARTESVRDSIPVNRALSPQGDSPAARAGKIFCYDPVVFLFFFGADPWLPARPRTTATLFSVMITKNKGGLPASGMGCSHACPLLPALAPHARPASAPS